NSAAPGPGMTGPLLPQSSSHLGSPNQPCWAATWWYPVRRSLAAALLARGNPAAAEREASAVLESWKRDPVTLAIRSRAEESRHEPRASSDRVAAQQGWFGDPKWLDDCGNNGPVMPGPGAAE